MSFYSDISYGNRDEWYVQLMFNRWFADCRGPILDIGCSVGHFVAVKPDLVEGIDSDEEALAEAARKGFAVRKIDIDKGEMALLPSGRYAAVHASQVIEHLVHTLDFLKEIHRVLAPGGFAVILTPNIPHMLSAFWDDYTHQRPLTKRSLFMAAYDAGFRDISFDEDFTSMPGVGRLMRLGVPPSTVARVQRFFGVRGPSIIMTLRKERAEPRGRE